MLGSLSHCVAMCGGLVTGVAGKSWRRTAAYHAGRVTTYAAIGALVGATGSLVNFAGEASGRLRLAAALVAGLFMIVTGLSLAGAGRYLPDRLMPGAWVSRAARPWMGGSGVGSALVLGLIFGFLPCGLIYTAASYALAAADPLQGAASMAAFGLGTLPALAATGQVFGRLQRYGALYRVAAGIVLVGFGVYYIVYGFPG
jgi:sulfite exporter TauE/SafE